MSGFLSDLRGVGAGLRSRIVYYVVLARRTTPGPALVRLMAAVSALVALVAALPAHALGSAWSIALALVFVPVGLFPRTRWVTVVAMVGIGAWLITTVVYGEPVSLWRTGLLAIGLYVMHTASAFAAVLPHDTVVAPGVLLHWSMRSGLVLAGSLAVALTGMAVAERLQPVRTLAAPVLGSVIAAGVAGMLAWQLRRR